MTAFPVLKDFLSLVQNWSPKLASLSSQADKSTDDITNLSRDIFAAKTTGSSNVYEVITVPEFSTLTKGKVYWIVPNHSNSGAATISFNGLNAVNIKYFSDTSGTKSDLASGLLVQDEPCCLYYDDTDLILIGGYHKSI